MANKFISLVFDFNWLFFFFAGYYLNEGRLLPAAIAFAIAWIIPNYLVGLLPDDGVITDEVRNNG